MVMAGMDDVGLEMFMELSLGWMIFLAEFRDLATVWGFIP